MKYRIKRLSELTEKEKIGYNLEWSGWGQPTKCLKDVNNGMIEAETLYNNGLLIKHYIEKKLIVPVTSKEENKI